MHEFVGKTKGKIALGTPNVGDRIILRRILEKQEGDVDLFRLAQDRDT
jgi:hypothetical protein